MDQAENNSHSVEETAYAALFFAGHDDVVDTLVHCPCTVREFFAPEKKQKSFENEIACIALQQRLNSEGNPYAALDPHSRTAYDVAIEAANEFLNNFAYGSRSRNRIPDERAKYFNFLKSNNRNRIRPVFLVHESAHHVAIRIAITPSRTSCYTTTTTTSSSRISAGHIPQPAINCD